MKIIEKGSPEFEEVGSPWGPAKFKGTKRQTIESVIKASYASYWQAVQGTCSFCGFKGLVIDPAQNGTLICSRCMTEARQPQVEKGFNIWKKGMEKGETHGR